MHPETWRWPRDAYAFRRGCPNFGVSTHSQIIKQPVLSSRHIGEENLENVTQMWPMRWCLLVFAKSPGWCMMLTQGSYFKWYSCYSLLCSSKQAGERKKEIPYYGNLKLNFPQHRPGANCPAKGWKMQTWKVASWSHGTLLRSHRLMLERKYQKILPKFVNLWYIHLLSESTLPYGRVTVPKTSVVWGYFCHHSLKAQASCTHQVYLWQKCVSFGWRRALAVLWVSSAQLSTPSLG